MEFKIGSHSDELSSKGGADEDINWVSMIGTKTGGNGH